MKMLMSDLGFHLTQVNACDIKSEIMRLKTKKGIFMNIPTKQLKEMCEVICEPLTEIWNTEIIQNKKLPSKLKLFSKNQKPFKLKIKGLLVYYLWSPTFLKELCRNRLILLLKSTYPHTFVGIERGATANMHW